MDIANTIFYVLIFIIGTLFGSFYTLAVYRIPKKQDITHTHSYCPNCNHKLGVIDLIPVWSYLFLGGKCRYCKQKIRPRYFILETLSGFTFVVLAYFMGLNMETVTEPVSVWGPLVAEYFFMILYITFVVLMAVTEKENRRIEKSVSVYGIVISIMYMIYLCIMGQAVIYRYVIYMLFYIFILVADTFTLKKYAKNPYTNGILLTIITMAIFTGLAAFCTAIYVLLIIAFDILFTKLKSKTKEKREELVDKDKNRTLPIGFFMGVANMVIFGIALTWTKFII